MSNIVVPQVEYIEGETRQETAALFNAKVVELRYNNPTFERTDTGFWIIYSKVISDTPTPVDTAPERASADRDYPRCAQCPFYEHVDDSVKWGRCTKYGNASVNRSRRVCTAYWKNLGGDELNA